MAPGDTLLLCTDGLTDVLSDSDIAAALAACERDAQAFSLLPKRLVHEALEAGSTDNVTALCCQFSASNHSDLQATCTAGYQLALVNDADEVP